MAQYRKVDSRIWNDAKFGSLSDKGKLCFFFLLTHPHMTALGAMRASLPGLASEIKWTEKAFREAFAEASQKGMAKHDEEASFLWLPNFLKYNRPESPNVVKAWASSWDLLPECKLKEELFHSLKDFVQGLTEGFQEAFEEAMPEDYAYTGAVAVAGAGKTYVSGAKKKKEPFVLPEWVPGTQWQAWIEARTKAKHPPTDFAKKLAVAKLAELRDQGQAPAAVLAQAAFHNWSGIFPLKESRG